MRLIKGKVRNIAGFIIMSDELRKAFIKKLLNILLKQQ
jgi:hypothetical protein